MQIDRSMGRERVREKDGEEVTALARGLDVLRRIAAADAPVSNRELTDWTGIPKPTISRITATLVGAGLLHRLPDSERFVLTASVLELSNGFLRNFDIRARARPFLIRLAEHTGLSVHLAVRDRLEMVVIDAIRPRSAVLVSRLEVGGRMDLSRTAVGRAYLAVLSEADRRALIGSLQTASGDDWPAISGGLQRGIDDALRLGFATSLGEWHHGLNAVAAGFVGPSEERYSVNCGGAAHQCPREILFDAVAPALLECIGNITREIGGTHATTAARAAS
ncbi:MULTISPECIES: IclR family transcriptional regulator [Caballeronia]|uniref:IclR family transcriptional regulator n=1 Tax=Caballeronia TaxID=1827195 RepID=UPI0002387A79|nr:MULTISPECIES: IclR family transcriptional regulator [unclassified Caballeronia]AET88685.1 transcriptional regulator, IclR family [Burkholderia sp. YI23]MCE4542367.1 IclR family transcriptional regulator [Caballeronia sp. PC1]MCE4568578.1 IclR family transcriptional regulator [Caballeronia sp. CLC5]